MRGFAAKFRTKSGQTGDCLISAAFIDFNEHRHAFMMALDYTERMHAERALHENQVRLSNVIEGTQAATWEWNVQTGETVFNERWAEIVGFTLKDLAPASIQTWLDLAHPEDLKKSEEQLAKVFAKTEQYYDCECRMKHRDGSWVWVHDRGKVIEWGTDGKPVRMVGTHTDITERKQAEEALRQSDQTQRTILGAMVEGVVFQGEDGTVLNCNASAEQILGLSRDQILGRTSMDPRWQAIHEDGSEFPGREHPAMMSLRTGKGCRDVVMGLNLPGGSQRWISINSEPLFKPGEAHPYAVITSFSDITGRRQAEEALRASEKKTPAAI